MERLYLYLLPHYKIRSYQCVSDRVVATKTIRVGGEEVQLHPFLTSAVDGGERSVHAPAAITHPIPQYSLRRRLSGHQSRSGGFGKERISSLYQESNPGPSDP